MNLVSLFQEVKRGVFSRPLSVDPLKSNGWDRYDCRSARS